MSGGTFDEIKSQRMDELLVYFKLPTVNAQLVWHMSLTENRR